MNISVRTLEIVAELYGISVADLKRGKQTKDIIEARQLATYLLIKLNLGYLLREDRITEINSYNKILRDMEANPVFKAFVEKILDYSQKACAMPKYEFATSTDILKTNRSMEITEREANILSKYRKGTTFRKIASAIKVTPVRIRQILLHTFVKELGQEAKRGFEINVQEYIDSQRDLHNVLRYLSQNQLLEISPEKLNNKSNKKSILLRR